MIINKNKNQIIGLCSLFFILINQYSFCQSYSIIDIDKINVIELSEGSIKDPPLYTLKNLKNINDLIKVKKRIKTSYNVDYIPDHGSIVIDQGRIYVDLDKKRSVYDLESGEEITNESNLYPYDYFVTRFKRKHIINQNFGLLSNTVTHYLASINTATGDTIWKIQREGYESVHHGKHISILSDSIISNRTGKKLFELKTSITLSIAEIKQDEEYLYIRTYGHEIIAIDVSKGQIVWRVRDNDMQWFFIDENAIYTSSQTAWNKYTGEVLWNKSSEMRLFGIVGDYLIGFLEYEEKEPCLYNKKSGEYLALLWHINGLCKDCLGYKYEYCNPQFVIAKEGEDDKTAALIVCEDGVYLYIFETS